MAQGDRERRHTNHTLHRRSISDVYHFSDRTGDTRCKFLRFGLLDELIPWVLYAYLGRVGWVVLCACSFVLICFEVGVGVEASGKLSVTLPTSPALEENYIYINPSTHTSESRFAGAKERKSFWDNVKLSGMYDVTVEPAF
jgi:hypothetical protein